MSLNEKYAPLTRNDPGQSTPTQPTPSPDTRVSTGPNESAGTLLPTTAETDSQTSMTLDPGFITSSPSPTTRSSTMSLSSWTTDSTSSNSSSLSEATTSVPDCAQAFLCYAPNEQNPANLTLPLNFEAFAKSLPEDNQTLRIARVEFYTGYEDAMHLLRIFEDDQSKPGARRMSEPFNSKPAPGWYGADVSPVITATPQTPYWIAWYPPEGVYASQASVGIPVQGLQKTTASANWAPHSPLLKMRVYCCPAP